MTLHFHSTYPERLFRVLFVPDGCAVMISPSQVDVAVASALPGGEEEDEELNDEGAQEEQAAQQAFHPGEVADTLRGLGVRGSELGMGLRFGLGLRC